jgi:hypothetical protein
LAVVIFSVMPARRIIGAVDAIETIAKGRGIRELPKIKRLP